MDTDLDTLATALYVTCDDLIAAHPEQAPSRPRIGIRPRITDAEIITLAVLQSLQGYTSEARWLRHVAADPALAAMFPRRPGQPGYNKRLRRLAGLMAWLAATLTTMTGVGDDDVWLVDSTPVECARSRQTVKRSDLAGWAEYGYCASHPRWFWGLRLHLLTTVHGLPVAWMLTGAKADERQVLAHMLDVCPAPAGGHAQIIIGDKNYFGREFEAEVEGRGLVLLRPARKGEQERPGARFFKPLRQIIESVNDTFKGQLDLERHGGRTIAGVCARVVQRVLGLTAAIWHNWRCGAPVLRSLTPYDH
jgi:hypothetical protein